MPYRRPGLSCRCCNPLPGEIVSQLSLMFFYTLSTSVKFKFGKGKQVLSTYDYSLLPIHLGIWLLTDKSFVLSCF